MSDATGQNDKQPGEGRGRLPEWLKRPIGRGERFERVLKTLRELHLETVCETAGCPNRGECYSRGTATFMIMGAICTRDCAFCGVLHSEPEALAQDEPERVAQAVGELGLEHVVITSVTRDDLADGGAGHFARTIKAVRRLQSKVTIEVLVPDFEGKDELVDVVCAARPEVFNHNLETTRRLTKEIRSGADYDRSLGVLRYAAEKKGARLMVKSGFMLGLGEEEQEIREMLQDLRAAGVQMVTIGQYLRPGAANRAVARYYRPSEFEEVGEMAKEMGFLYVAAGPFVRSSYHAELGLKARENGKCFDLR